MKHKIMKPSGLTLLSCLCIAVVADSNHLKIFRNIDDSIVEVPSKVEVPIGAKLTLICQIENIKSTGFINGYVTWFIPAKIHSKLKLRTLKNSSNLVFSNVNSNDEGLYVCASLKFNVFKTLLLLVKQRKFAEINDLNTPRLLKREVVPADGFYDFNHTDPYYDNRDLTELKNSLAKMREDLLIDIKNENNRPDYGSYDHDINLNKRGHPNTNSFPIKAVLTGFGTLLAIVVIFLIIRYCLFMKPRSSTNRRINRLQDTDNPEVTVPRINRCGHVSCSGNNLLNPEGACRFQNESSPITPIVFDAMDIIRPYSTANPTTQLDLPPTYSSSTHNSTRSLNDTSNGFNKKNLQAANSDNLNLPPSYDEAIGHKNNQNRHSGHSHRGDNDNVHHSAGAGFSGGGDSHSAGGAGDDSGGSAGNK